MPRVETRNVLRNKVGLHARPATLFVKTAMKFKSTIKVIKDGMEADAKSLLSVLSIDARQDDELTIIAEGEDAEAAIKELVELVERNLGEE